MTAAIHKSIALSHGHLNEDLVEEYCFNRLTPSVASTVDLHLKACDDCRRAVANQRQFIRCMKQILTGYTPAPSRKPSQPRFSPEDLAAARNNMSASKVAGIEALRLLQKEEASVNDVERIVQTDPILSAHLIRVANSALLSYGGEARTVRHAIARVGFDRTRLHIWALSVKRMFLTPSLQRVWNHSTQMAQVCRHIAELTRVIPCEEAGLVALIHDIGHIVLGNIGAPYERSFAQRLTRGFRPVQIERHLCGVSHAEIGADLLASWRFPADLVEAVRNHHTPSRSTSPLAAVLYIAESWLDNNEDTCDLEEHAVAMGRLNLNYADLRQLSNTLSPDLEMLRFVA